ncbi:MAG: EAL domain-containing protein, partial [Oscillospiraceae bacterium]|nr:EAL domain-containing protein [Oscillospiraceae bacterium]
MIHGDILPVLYDISLTIGGETKLRPLLTRTLQRLLYHTSYACGFVCLDTASCSTDNALSAFRLDAAVGDFGMLSLVGKTAMMPCELIMGAAAQENEQHRLLEKLSFTRSHYRAFLRLPIENLGVIILLSIEQPKTDLPLTKILQPILAHLAKAINLCRVNEAYTAELLHHRLLLSKAFDSSYTGIVITDADGLTLEINPAFTQLTKYEKNELLGTKLQNLLRDTHCQGDDNDIWDLIKKENHWEGEIQVQRKDGELFQAWRLINPILDDRGNATNYVLIFSDISKQKEAEERIHQLAYFDALTDLPNRRLLIDRLRQAIAITARTKNYGAILFLDLDDFKTLNDTKGYLVGDLLLIEVAKRLMANVREMDVVSRQGGDEFVVVLQNLSKNATEAARQAEYVAEKIRKVLSEKYILEELESRSTPSIGITLFQGDEQSVDVLLKHADTAMYQAKKAGRNMIKFFDPEMQAKLEERQKLTEDLEQATKNNEFILYYQKQVNSGNGTTGAEVLLRWKHSKRGLVSPASFIPLAEETGIIVQIGTWVLKQACLQLKAWELCSYTESLSLAVNVSAKQFRMPNFVDQVCIILHETGARPSNLKLELTESMVLENVEDAILKMNQLKQYGISFSMDDFGTGYSSLRYLKLLPLKQLKIDQGFVRDMTDDVNDAVIVQTIIAMTKAMGLEVIAEGVETKAQHDFLETYGCQNFQGYLFAKPVPIEEFDI